MSADAADAGTAPGAPGTGEGAEGTELTEGQLGGEGTEGEGGATPPDTSKDDLAHWKEMARKHERRARENAAAAAKLKTIETANMTELEKAQAAQREAERERDEARDMHARMLAAATHDLPVELIDFLGSGTEEEISERAELLGSVIEETAKVIAEEFVKEQIAAGKLIDPAANRNGGQQPQLGARPVESLRAGSAPAGTAPNTQEEWFRQLLGQ